MCAYIGSPAKLEHDWFTQFPLKRPPKHLRWAWQECEQRLSLHEDPEFTVPDPYLPLEEKLARRARLAAREQAATAGLPVGSTWGAGGNPKTPPAAPL